MSSIIETLDYWNVDRQRIHACAARSGELTCPPGEFMCGGGVLGGLRERTGGPDLGSAGSARAGTRTPPPARELPRPAREFPRLAREFPLQPASSPAWHASSLVWPASSPVRHASSPVRHA